jgi:hypothetical protein
MATRKPSWQSFEKTAARKHRGSHVGGPGRPDYTRGDVQGEAKLRRRPLTKTELMKECQKGRTEIVCPAGFTEEAKKYAQRYRQDVKLIKGR